MEARTALNQAIYDAVVKDDIPAIENFTSDQLSNYQDIEYGNIFLVAASDGNAAMVRKIIFIIYGNSPPNLTELIDKHGRGALILAANANSRDLLNYLVEELKFPINSRNLDGHSALSYAIYSNHCDAFEYLLLNGAEFTSTEADLLYHSSEFKKYFNSPFCFLLVVRSGNYGAFRYLMNHIVTQPDDVQQQFYLAKDAEGRNALLLAAFSGHEQIAIELSSHFQVEEKDSAGHTSLHYVHAKNCPRAFLRLSTVCKEIPLEEAKHFASTPYFFNGQDRKVIGNAITIQVRNTDQEGRISKVYTTEIQRPPRSYAPNREGQFLRQVATQLYYHFKKQLIGIKGINLKEIQIMHLAVGGKHNLFIVANEYTANNYLPRNISKDNFSQALTTAYRFSVKGDTAKDFRSRSHARKLSDRIFGSALAIPQSSDETDAKQAGHVARILRQGELKTFRLEYNKKNQFTDNSKNTLEFIFNNHESSVFFVEINTAFKTTWIDRHAEEFLVDIGEQAKSLGQASDSPVRIAIAGKKRPCVGCAGRMEGVVDKFNPRPGLFWIHTLERQPPIVAARTIGLFFKSPSHVTLDKYTRTLVPDHDSDSDSDVENGLGLR